MKYITTIIQNIIQKSHRQMPLGRWQLTQCSKQINHKIDLSNEDHCGPCGQYALEKRSVSKAITNDSPPPPVK